MVATERGGTLLLLLLLLAGDGDQSLERFIMMAPICRFHTDTTLFILRCVCQQQRQCCVSLVGHVDRFVFNHVFNYSCSFFLSLIRFSQVAKSTAVYIDARARLNICWV